MDSYDVIVGEVKDYWKVNYPQDVVAFFRQKYSWDDKWERCEELVECHGSDDYENMSFLSDFCEGQTEVEDVVIIPLSEVTAFYYERKIESHESAPSIRIPKRHGRLIDADALVEDLKRQCEEVFKIDAVSPDDFWITRDQAYNEKLWKTWCESFFEYLKTRETIIPASEEK